MPPLQVISKLRKEGVPEKDIPSTRQIKNLKTSLKNDHSETSKHRLLTLSDLKHYFEAKLVTSKENYALLGEELAAPCLRVYLPCSISSITSFGPIS